jgi:hypothetical protein
MGGYRAANAARTSQPGGLGAVIRSMGQVWRPMSEADLAIVNWIASGNHSLHERPIVFEEKLKLFPAGCFVLADSYGITGYGFAHPWLLYDAPKLDELLFSLPLSPNCMLIHDVVVLPKGRSRRAAAVYSELIADVARENELDHLALVSVYGTYALWSRYGFVISDRSDMAEHLSSYGATAHYMLRNLG